VLDGEIVMNAEPRADGARDPWRCQHKMPLREKPSGFASPETICVECGQSFDADEEQELRHRDQAAQRDTPWVNPRKGYIVG
jgi:hypothetical protein